MSNKPTQTSPPLGEIEGGRNPQPLTPKLRFPEFRDKGAWEEKRLSEVSERITEKVGDASLIPVSITAGYGFVSQKSKFGRDISGAQYKNYTYLRRGDFAYNKGNSKKFPQGYICQLKEFDQAAASTAFMCFRLNNGYDASFIQGLFDKNTHGWQLARYITSSARSDGLLNISKQDFFNILLPIPSLPEQQKIADCLTSLDDLIAAHSQKLDALRAHKKGLLQQLFPAEGESVPKLRFPEFRDKGAWEGKKLGEISKFASGGTPSKNKPEYWNGTTPWISAASMYDTNIVNSDLKITDLAINSGARIAKKGSLLILVRGSMLFKRVPMGIAAIDVAFNQDVKALTVEDSINTIFLLYQLLALEARIPINETGIGAGKIETDNLKRFAIHILPFPEQKKIADCLTNLDDQITAQVKKIEALKEHKKGLLQQLFPSTKAVR